MFSEGIERTSENMKWVKKLMEYVVIISLIRFILSVTLHFKNYRKMTTAMHIKKI